jgi:hypothetical protein
MLLLLLRIQMWCVKGVAARSCSSRWDSGRGMATRGFERYVLIRWSRET